MDQPSTLAGLFAASLEFAHPVCMCFMDCCAIAASPGSAVGHSVGVMVSGAVVISHLVPVQPERELCLHSQPNYGAFLVFCTLSLFIVVKIMDRISRYTQDEETRPV